MHGETVKLIKYFEIMVSEMRRNFRLLGSLTRYTAFNLKFSHQSLIQCFSNIFFCGTLFRTELFHGNPPLCWSWQHSQSTEGDVGLGCFLSVDKITIKLRSRVNQSLKHYKLLCVNCSLGRLRLF